MPPTGGGAPSGAEVDAEAVARALVAAYPLLVRAVLAGQERSRRPEATTAERLTPPQVLALMVIEGGDRTISEVAAGTGVGLSSATRMVQGLERLALVARVAPDAAEDRRRRPVRLTDLGRATLAERRGRQHDRFAGLVRPLPPEARAALADGVRAFTEALRIDDSDPPPDGLAASRH